MYPLNFKNSNLWTRPQPSNAEGFYNASRVAAEARVPLAEVGQPAPS